VSKVINTGQTWEHRLALRLPGPLFIGAFLIAMFLIAAYLSFQWFFGFGIEPSAFGLVVLLVAALIAPAYFFGPYNHLHETEFRKFFIARNVIRTSRFAGAAGVLVFIGLWELIQVSQGRDFLSLWTHLHAGSSITAMFLWLGWLIGRIGYFSSAGIWDRPGPQRSDIDLLKLENIYVIGRSGLEGALVWFIVIAITGLLILPEVGTGLWVVLSILAVTVGGGLMFLFIPAKKIRNLIRDVKHEELARLEPLLRQARDDTLTHDSSSVAGRLGDLLAYKTQVESTQEWPFDSSTLFRFGLYLLIPIGSMVGGALVERVVDLVLD
jgi:hypothetical protein